MKILTIQAAYFPMIGGAELFHQKIATHLASKGHQVDVLTCIWQKPDQEYKNWKKRHEKVQKINIYRVKPWFYLQFLKTLGAVWPLYQKACSLQQRKKYSLVHCHIMPALLVGALLKKEFNIKLITTIQGGDLADYQEIGGNINWLLKPVIAWGLKQADKIHVVSSYLRDQVSEMGVKNKKIEMIPNGVDPIKFKVKYKDRYKIYDSRFKNKKIKFISVSRLEKKNNLALLIEVVNQLRKQDWDINLDIYGDGRERKKLEAGIKKLELSKYIRLKGYLEHDRLPKALSEYDFMIRLSSQEGFGIAFIEAMACGVIPIGSPVGGITDIIKDRENGYLISINKSQITSTKSKIIYSYQTPVINRMQTDGPTLAIIVDQLVKVLKDKKNWEKISQNAEKIVVKKYLWNKVNDKFEQVVKSL